MEELKGLFERIDRADTDRVYMAVHGRALLAEISGYLMELARQAKEIEKLKGRVEQEKRLTAALESQIMSLQRERDDLQKTLSDVKAVFGAK